MNKTIKLNLGISRNVKKLESFLANFDLKLDVLSTAYVVTNQSDEWIGCGGRYNNVLKCFAVDEKHRNEALLDILITKLIEDSYSQGYDDLFVYTKSENSILFASYSFNLVADTGKVCLLHRGPKDIKEVLSSLDIVTSPHEIIGAIVMNANPFTKGHRYLVEVSSNKVDKLIVFVVENDASRFPFEDRLMLVKKQTNDLKNVTVLPSTSFIISNATFPSYFLKEESLIDVQHAIMDAIVFKKYFIPYFNIKKRFLGDEPIDQSTAIYNKTLSEILPPDCKIKIIERKKYKDNYISASTVRKELDTGNFDAIRNLVPEETYKYLKENYGQYLRL